MNDDLQPLQVADLSLAQLELLFRDLEYATESLLEVRVKGGAEERSNPLASLELSAQLSVARSGIRARSVRGVQRWYRFQGDTFCDTVIVAGASFRLVRSRVPEH